MPLLTPLELHGARDAAEYREKQRLFIRKHFDLSPRVAAVNPPALLDGGALRIKCGCGNYAVVDPVARIACCFQCGLVYEQVQIPEGY
jgi:hypothetical protein